MRDVYSAPQNIHTHAQGEQYATRRGYSAQVGRVFFVVLDQKCGRHRAGRCHYSRPADRSRYDLGTALTDAVRDVAAATRCVNSTDTMRRRSLLCGLHEKKPVAYLGELRPRALHV